MHRLTIPTRTAAALLGLLAAAAAARGQTTFTWNNAAGGTFSASANWTPAGGPPGVGENAIFNLSNTYDVLFSSSTTNAALLVQDGIVILKPSGASRTYTLSASSSATNGHLAVSTSGSFAMNVICQSAFSAIN